MKLKPILALLCLLAIANAVSPVAFAQVSEAKPAEPKNQKIFSVSLTLTNRFGPPTVIGHRFTRFTLRSVGLAEKVSDYESGHNPNKLHGRFSAAQFEQLVAMIELFQAIDLPNVRKPAEKEVSTTLNLNDFQAEPVARESVDFGVAGVNGDIALRGADFNPSERWIIEKTIRGLSSEIVWSKPLTDEQK